MAFYVPYHICFSKNKVGDQQMETADYIEIIVDVLFGIDIIVNFVSSYEDP